MRTKAGVAALLLGVMGIATSVAVMAESIESEPIDSQATQAQQSGSNMSRAIGICRMAESVPRPAELGGGQNGLSPVAATRGYFKTFEHQLVSGVSKVKVLQNPAHGTLEDLGTLAYDQFGEVTGDTGERSYIYNAEAGYDGQDSATLLVEMGGYQVKVTYFFHVFAEVIYDDIPLMDQYCPNGYYWKISSTLDTDHESIGSDSIVNPAVYA